MPYTPQTDKIRVFNSQGNFSPTRAVTQAAISSLENITAADKAQAVPRILMWQVDPATGRALRANSDGSPKSPLSLLFVELPLFGAQVGDDIRFRERPPVSLDQIVIKQQNPRGLILYRTLDITIVVHRPEIIFDDPRGTDEKDTYAALVTPGNVFALEYGWSTSPGIRNGILNGEGVADGRAVIPGKTRIMFTVTSYTFDIRPDSQMRFQIKAYEAGEFKLRQAFIGGNTNYTPEQLRYLQSHGRFPTNVEQNLYKNDRAALVSIINEVKGLSTTTVSSTNRQIGKYITFGTLVEKIFLPIIKNSFEGDTGMGIDLDTIVIGPFNSRCGKPVNKFSGGQNMSGQSIAEFIFPIDVIMKEFQQLLNVAERITLYNVMTRFTQMMSDPQLWESPDGTDPATKTTPEVNIKTTYFDPRPGERQRVMFNVFDAYDQYVRFSFDDKDKLEPTSPRDLIKQRIVDRGIPYISFQTGNSYLKGAEFGVIQDEQMASIFINNALGGNTQIKNRMDVTSKASAPKKDRAPLAQQIYSPVIQGTLDMIGNFAFDTFGLIWIDFGVKRWDGPFNVQEREDTIGKNGFQTKIKVYSAGTDPLGTQGRNAP